MNGMDFYVGVEVLAIGFETISMYYWARLFSDRKKNNYKTILGINSFIFCIVGLATILFKDPMTLIAIAFLTSFIVLVFQNKKIRESIFLAFLYCVFMAISDALASFLLMGLLNQNLEEILILKEYRIYGMIIAKLITFMFIGFVYSYRKRHEFFKISLGKTMIYFAILPITSILILYQMSRYTYISNSIDSWINLLGISGLIIANVSVFLFFEKDQILKDQQIKENILRVQIQNQRNYYEKMETNAKEVRRISHDMKSRLTVLSGYAENGDINSIIKYLGQIKEEVAHFTPLMYTGFPGIDSIIAEKMDIIEKSGIIFEKRLKFSKSLEIDEMEVCIILGNLLDNALEACEKSEEKKRNIFLKMESDEKSLSIYMENTMNKKNIQVKGKLIETTKEDKINHGFGMLTIRKIVQKYKGVYEWEMEEEKFIVDIILFF